jgi:hypothetical protein
MVEVCAHSVDAERRRDMVQEGNRILLRGASIDPQGTNPRGIINCRVLIAADALAAGPLERQEFHVDLR